MSETPYRREASADEVISPFPTLMESRRSLSPVTEAEPEPAEPEPEPEPEPAVGRVTPVEPRRSLMRRLMKPRKPRAAEPEPRPSVPLVPVRRRIAPPPPEPDETGEAVAAIEAAEPSGAAGPADAGEMLSAELAAAQTVRLGGNEETGDAATVELRTGADGAVITEPESPPARPSTALVGPIAVPEPVTEKLRPMKDADRPEAADGADSDPDAGAAQAVAAADDAETVALDPVGAAVDEPAAGDVAAAKVEAAAETVSDKDSSESEPVIEDVAEEAAAETAPAVDAATDEPKDAAAPVVETETETEPDEPSDDAEPVTKTAPDPTEITDGGEPNPAAETVLAAEVPETGPSTAASEDARPRAAGTEPVERDEPRYSAVSESAPDPGDPRPPKRFAPPVKPVAAEPVAAEPVAAERSSTVVDAKPESKAKAIFRSRPRFRFKSSSKAAPATEDSALALAAEPRADDSPGDAAEAPAVDGEAPALRVRGPGLPAGNGAEAAPALRVRGPQLPPEQ